MALAVGTNPFDVVFAGKAPRRTPVPSTAPDMLGILRQAGFKGDALRTAYAVSKAESGHRPTAFNPNASTGDKSYGLFQINMLGAMGPERRRQYGLKSNEELYDPLTNAKIAYRMSGGGKNWSPWSAYKSGAYKQYLGEAPEFQEMPLARGPAPVRELPLARGAPGPFRELADDNPFSAFLGKERARGQENPFQSVLEDSPFAGVVGSRQPQSVLPQLMPQAPASVPLKDTKAKWPIIGGSVGGEHGTSGLSGYTGKDYFARPGSPVVAPVGGTVVKLSGHDPRLGAVQGAGGPLGWSVYIQGDDGHNYFMTHLGSRSVRPGQRVQQGQQIATVADYDSHGRASHVHMGYR